MLFFVLLVTIIFMPILDGDFSSNVAVAIVFRGKGDYQIDYVPAPRVTEADKTNDRRYRRRAQKIE